MRKFIRLAAAVGAGAILTAIGTAPPAGATPPNGYGFDDTAHVIVGGGSDTTWAAMLRITVLWDGGAQSGCPVTTAAGANLNNCIANVNPEVNSLSNWQHDTVAQAGAVGSGAGIDSLNAFTAGDNYHGAVNGAPANVDFARSSRGPKTTGGVCTGGNELTCDTFWGFAQDGIEVMGFNARGTELQGDATGLTDAELFNIWNCTYHLWSDIPSLGITPGSATDGPIVAWGMNPSSGTYGTFNTHEINTGGAPAGWLADGQACVHKLTNGTYSFENDIKPIFNDVQANGMLAAAPQPAAPPGITAGQNDITNPVNWIWFGSFGVLNAYSYTSNYTVGGTPYAALPSPVDGLIPSSANIGGNTYPIGRTLFHVTKKTDADCPKSGGVCNFAQATNPGPAIGTGAVACSNGTGALCDLRVDGGASGNSGAVREFTRFLCRVGATQQALDPLTGKSYNVELTSAVNADGFTVVPVGLRSSGSRCGVQS
jgi:ABC-type phosphate transport system substrate-binding protein